MPYTTVDAVCGMFPVFQRNGNKGPSDTLIQNYVNDIGTEIDTILMRRFQEAYQSFGPTPAAAFAAWAAQFSPEQLNKLECINRFGACAELGISFETAGIAAAARVAKTFEDKYEAELNKLNARDKNGKPLEQGGDYDFLFDNQAKVETPRPQMGGIPGGDQRPGQSDGTSTVFKKWDRREF
jgi:hypothetical protein